MNDALIVLIFFSLRGLKKSFKKMQLSSLTKVYTALRFRSMLLCCYIVLIIIQHRSTNEDFYNNCLIAIILDNIVTGGLTSAQEL